MPKNNKSESEISYANLIEKKLDFFARNAVVSLFIIGAIGLFIRLYYFPNNIPVTADAIIYFWYAIDISIVGHIPGYLISNDGWPLFLSVFFSIFRFDNFMDYMLLQRILTVSISILTIIPVYLLCKRFFDKFYALVGAAIFAFEPRIIQNSLAGITEPLYIILGTSALFFFFDSNKKIIYCSFFIMALCFIVRTEGLFLFFALSIMFFVRNKKELIVIGKYALALAIFILTLLPIVSIRTEISGQDPSIGKLQSSSMYVIEQSSSEGGVGFGPFVMEGLETLIKFIGWDLIPIFIFFVPIGFFLILKNRNHNNLVIVVTIFFMLMPALFAYASKAFDTRYLFFLYPLFCVISIFTIKSFVKKFNFRNTVLILLIGGILLSSSLFLDFKKMDYEHEREALSIAYHVVERTEVINQYFLESFYLPIVGMSQLDNFPILKSDFIDPTKMSQCVDVQNCNSILPITTDSLEDFIESGKSKGLTHLVVDSTENPIYRPYFLKDVFYHEDEYPYLIKEFDSLGFDYKYHIKIFMIDYEKFEFQQRQK